MVCGFVVIRNDVLNIILVVLMFFSSAVVAEENLPIVTADDVYEEYLCLVANRELMSIDDYSGKCSKRVTVEIILIQQMLALGGFQYPFKLEPGYYNLKERKLIQSGLLLVSVDSVWHSEAQAMEEFVYISPAIIRAGEFVAGFYTIGSNEKLLATKTLADLRALAVVSSKNWTNDWQALQQAKFTQVYHEPIWTSQAKMVEQNLADVMLIPFSNDEELSYTFWQTQYKPIPNFFLRLPESRHFIISKKHPLGKQAYEALVKGMAILRAKGTITQAFQQSGLFNEKVKDWQQVNP